LNPLPVNFSHFFAIMVAFATQHARLTLTWFERVSGLGSWLLLSGTRSGLALRGNERWYLVHTLPHNERPAQLHLGAQGYRTHFPTIQKTIRHARKLRTVQAPLFPRYVFLILDLGRDRWLSVRGTVGVSSLFTSEDRPVPVPEGIVETLIQNSDEANLALFSSGLTTGQSVRILSGPFANFVGKLERLDAAGRVRVLLDMMGTAVPVALRRGAICPAAA
jgi:transcription elongation factor/antiterminator RfaH